MVSFTFKLFMNKVLIECNKTCKKEIKSNVYCNVAIPRDFLGT